MAASFIMGKDTFLYQLNERVITCDNYPLIWRGLRPAGVKSKNAGNYLRGIILFILLLMQVLKDLNL